MTVYYADTLPPGNFDTQNARTPLEIERRPTVGCGMASRTQSANAVSYAKFRSRSHNALIRVYDEAGNVIETHKHAGDFREW